MDLVGFTEYLIKNLVKEPDMVSVKQFEDDEDCVMIEVLVSASDKGAVIGKKGMVANAIRTLVQAASYTNGNRRIRINIDSF